MQKRASRLQDAEEIYHKGVTKDFQDNMILFHGIDEIVGLDRVREVEAHYYKDLLTHNGG